MSASRWRKVVTLAAAVPLALGLVATPAPAAPTTFTHPGVLVSRPQLDFVKAQVNMRRPAVESRLRPSQSEHVRIAFAHAETAFGRRMRPVLGPEPRLHR